MIDDSAVMVTFGGSKNNSIIQHHKATNLINQILTNQFNMTNKSSVTGVTHNLRIVQVEINQHQISG
jgi:hypothetical protein